MASDLRVTEDIVDDRGRSDRNLPRERREEEEIELPRDM